MAQCGKRGQTPLRIGTCLLGQPARAEVFRFLELRGVGAVTVRAGGLENGRQALEARIRQEDAEALADLACEDVRVTVAVRAERHGGVVDVERAQLLEP